MAGGREQRPGRDGAPSPDWGAFVNRRGQVSGRQVLFHLTWTTLVLLAASLWWYRSGLWR
ncbi:MAG: hypothetical protein ACYDEN_04865 [Acidimicrobiales bacterium]